MPEVAEEMTVEKLMGIMNAIDEKMKGFTAQLSECTAIMNKQTKMLEVAADLMCKLAMDETVDLNVRRRISFALDQISGIGKW